MSTRIPTGATEPIVTYAVTTRGIPITGLTDIYLKVQRLSDYWFLDWSDWTFKAAGHVSIDHIMAEADSLRLPGVYRLAGNFPTASLTNALPSDSYLFRVFQSPGTNAHLPGPAQLDVGGWANIEDTVWDAPLASHLDVGSTGEALRNLSAAMTGSQQITIQIRDTLAAPIQGAVVDLFDGTNTFFLTRFTTPLSGNVTLALDPGTYSIRIYKTGFVFTVPETLVVTVDATVTYTGTSLVSIIAPSAPNLCVIYGTVRNAAGNPIPNAQVTAYADTPQVVQGTQQHILVACTVTDGLGAFQLELERGALVNFAIEDTGLDVLRTVPNLPSQDVATWV